MRIIPINSRFTSISSHHYCITLITTPYYVMQCLLFLKTDRLYLVKYTHMLHHSACRRGITHSSLHLTPGVISDRRPIPKSHFPGKITKSSCPSFSFSMDKYILKRENKRKTGRKDCPGKSGQQGLSVLQQEWHFYTVCLHESCLVCLQIFAFSSKAQ